MSSENIKNRIVKVMICDLELAINPNEIDASSRLDDFFGMDSIAITELVIGIEDEFHIKFPNEDLSLEVFQDLKTLTEYVKTLLSETGFLEDHQKKTLP